jgi:hypothetical protein
MVSLVRWLLGRLGSSDGTECIIGLRVSFESLDRFKSYETEISKQLHIMASGESAECKRYHDWMKMLDDMGKSKLTEMFPVGQAVKDQGRIMAPSGGTAIKFLAWRVRAQHDGDCVPEMHQK